MKVGIEFGARLGINLGEAKGLESFVKALAQGRELIGARNRRSGGET